MQRWPAASELAHAGLPPCRYCSAPRRSSLACRASPAAATDIGHLKTQLREQAGPKNGLDRTPEQKLELNNTIKALEAAAGPARKADLTGTTWRLVATNSASSSGGKLGPFIGPVEQEFPRDQQGKYINKVLIGPLKASLGAKYYYESDEQIAVKFEYIQFQLGTLPPLKREFGNQGTWRMTLSDDDLRILYTNRGNVFALERIPEGKLGF